MSGIRIDFTLRGGNRVDRFRTEGTLRNERMDFTDDNGDKHTLEMGEKALDYRREGDNDLDFTFEKGKLHKGEYHIRDGTMVFDVETHELTMDQERIHIVYTLKQSGQPVHHAEIELHYEQEDR